MNEYGKAFEDAGKMSEKYYDMYKKAGSDMEQDLRAVGKTEDEIIKELITTAYLYGYVDAKLNTIESIFPDAVKKEEL